MGLTYFFTKMNKTTVKEWEERFWGNWYLFNRDRKREVFTTCGSEVRDFIRQVRTEAIHEEREKVRKWLNGFREILEANEDNNGCGIIDKTLTYLSDKTK